MCSFSILRNSQLESDVCRLLCTRSLNSLIFGHNYCPSMQKLLFRWVGVRCCGKETLLLKPSKVFVGKGFPMKRGFPSGGGGGGTSLHHRQNRALSE